MRLLYLLFGCLFTSFAFGQWTSDYSANTQVAESHTSDVQSVGTNDGKTFVVFWDEDAGYKLRVQLLDTAGYQQFGPNGMLVNAVADNGTWTATRSNVVDEDGNLYIGFTATNEGNGYVNKISSDGTQMFGENGIMIPDGWDLKLLPLPDGGVLVGWQGANYGMLMKYDENGNPVWPAPKEMESADPSLPYSNIGEMTILSDGTFVVIVHGKGTVWMIDSKVSAFRISEDGDAIWSISPISEQTLASNRRYSLIQKEDVVYFGYYGSTGFRFDSFLQRINPDGSLPWGIDGADFSTDDTFYEMTGSIVADESSSVVWFTANVSNQTQSEFGQYIQKFDMETGERLLGDHAKEIFPVSADNWISVGDIQLAGEKPLILFANDISNGVNPIQLGVVLLDTDGNFEWQDEYLMIATSPGNKYRCDFTKNVNGQSVAVWAEDRNGGYFSFAQNVVIEDDTQSVNDIDKTEVLIYPNPARNTIFVRSDIPISKIEILDLSRNKLLRESSSATIGLENLPNGIYLIRTILQNKSVIVKKFIKN